jgi:hypothetical protein
MSIDLDNELGFWLKGIPYLLYTKGDKLKDCYRYYLFPDNGFKVNIFKNGVSEELTEVRNKFKGLKDCIDFNLIYTPFPIKYNTKYNILINLFSIFIYDFEIKLNGLYTNNKFIPFDYEFYKGIRIEGIPVKKIDIPKSLENIITIVNPITNYKKNINLII